LIKVFSRYPPKKTIKFIWFSGEEQGLVGSTASATNVVNRGEKDHLKLMVNMDMIGYSRTADDLKVLLETKREFSDTSDLFKKWLQIIVINWEFLLVLIHLDLIMFHI